MLSLSTAYNITKHDSWETLLSSIRKLGFSAVELNVQVPEKWMAAIARSVERGDITISSLHNYCPCIENLPKDRTIYSGYFLTAPEEEERRLAVTYTKRTIEWAGRLGARAVVLHAGEITTDPTGSAFYEYVRMGGRNGMLYKQYCDALLADRAKKSPRYMEILIKSLDECLPLALKNRVTLCLENRFYVHEVPNVEETKFLLGHFNDAPLGYWHDTGHAEVFVRMGFVKKHTDILDALSYRMTGMHLHDIEKMSDHYAPGTKELDFSMFKPYVTPQTLFIVEAHGKSRPEEVRDSIAYLKSAGLPY